MRAMLERGYVAMVNGVVQIQATTNGYAWYTLSDAGWLLDHLFSTWADVLACWNAEEMGPSSENAIIYG